MERANELGYAGNGLVQIREAYIRPAELPPLLRVPSEVEQLLTAGKQHSINEQLTQRYNTVKLLRWTVEDITELNAAVLLVEPSELNVALTLLKMMEMAQLVKAGEAEEVRLLKGAAEMLKGMLEESARQCEECSKRAKDELCRLVSENCRRSRDALLPRRKEIIAKPELLASKFLEIELNCIFANLLLNFRRLIRQRLAEGPRTYGRALKLLELKLYYLSMAPSKTEGYVRRVADDIFHSDRPNTYIYLLHDERGLAKLSKYFEEAPLAQLERDMRLISERYQEEMKAP